MARAYLGAFWNRRYCRGDAGSVIGTLRDVSVVVIVDGSTLVYGAVVGIGDGTTLGDGAVVGVGDFPLGGYFVGARVYRDVASIPCRVLMACMFHPPLQMGMMALDC